MLYNLKVNKGIDPMTKSSFSQDDFIPDDYSEEELEALAEEQDRQDYFNSIPTFSELNS